MDPVSVLPEMSSETWEVIVVLRNQVELVRIGQILNEGHLKYFRKAIRMDNFYHAVKRIRETLRFEIFSTVQEIESIENAIINHDRTQLIVQCCVILHFCEIIGYPEERFPDPSREHSWLFASYKHLEEIAYLRSRLHFVRPVSYVLEAINYSLLRAVENCFRDPDRLSTTWQGLLLIFRESDPFCTYRLLTLLIRILQDRTIGMPRAAATLFLSYVADAIFFLAAHIGNYADLEETKLIKMLLKLGASPMISKEHHPVLFERLKDEIQTERSPWWMESEESTSSSSKRFPTALNKFLAHEWSREFFKTLDRHTCCSLDATNSFKTNYRSNRVPSLHCLAAQNLRESDLDVLSPTLKFIASKHRPISLK